MSNDLHAALLDECRRLGEIAPDELAGAVAALRGVVERHGDRNGWCTSNGFPWPCTDARAIADALGIEVSAS